jgi:hypothetical protein
VVETTQRFIRDIAERVGLENITEVHLFPALRQGGIETGVAVVAAIVPDDDTIEKHTVFSAHYRNTIKGPDRGKWEVEVRAEADAPLATVDDVVRGVMKRAGEQFEPERLSANEVRTVVTADAV